MDSEAKRMVRSFVPALLLVSALWLVKLVEWQTGQIFTEWGVYPRSLSGLKGILFSPFVHGDFKHLISNSAPLLILGTGLVYFYRALAFRVFILVYLLGGFWLWLGGRDSFHIGASGLVYGLTVFIFLSGVLRRDTRLMALSLLVVFLYGGMVWGLFPLFKGISWEAHLFGSLAGGLMAIVYRKEGPQRKKYLWEVDEEEEVIEDEDAYWKVPENDTPSKLGPPQEDTTDISYIYVRKEDPNTQQSDDEKN